jgi:hypothetical protein
MRALAAGRKRIKFIKIRLPLLAVKRTVQSISRALETNSSVQQCQITLIATLHTFTDTCICTFIALTDTFYYTTLEFEEAGIAQSV